MDQMIFYAHSGLRFLVLLAGAMAAAVLLWGWRANRPFAGQARAATAVFTGTLDLQVLIGLATVFMRPWYGALIGHLVMMVAAALAAHAVLAYARRQAEPRRANQVAFAGVVLALVLILGGIMAIRSSPFEMTPGAGATATSAG